MKSRKQRSGMVRQRNLSTRLAPVVFLGPAILLLILISVIPLVYSLYLSTQNYNLSMPNRPMKFIGLENYRVMLLKPEFRESLGWTLIFSAVSVVVETVLGLGIALMLHSDSTKRYSAPFKTIMIIPMMIAPVVSATIWKLMYYPVYGVLNNALAMLGITGPNWLGETFYAKIAIIIVEIWGATPFCILVYQAALNTVSTEMIEAARVDGASAGRVFFSITLPSIRNFIALVVSIRIADSLRIFDIVMQLTNGAPGSTTETIGTTIYKAAFRYYQVGQGSAGAFLFFIVISIVSLVSMMLMRRRED